MGPPQLDSGKLDRTVVTRLDRDYGKTLAAAREVEQFHQNARLHKAAELVFKIFAAFFYLSQANGGSLLLACPILNSEDEERTISLGEHG
jgi:hypothetical protein